MKSPFCNDKGKSHVWQEGAIAERATSNGVVIKIWACCNCPAVQVKQQWMEQVDGDWHTYEQWHDLTSIGEVERVTTF